MEKKYAVVKAVNEKRFTKWHDTFNEAHDEAERLCRLEKRPFYVISAMARCFIEETPVKWDTSESILDRARVEDARTKDN